VSEARQQLLDAIEGAVSSTLDRRLDAIADELADRIAERMNRNGTDEAEWITAAEVARRYSVSRDFVYEHSERLGAERMGDGPKARLRFDPRVVTEALAPRPHPLTKPERPNPRRKRPPAGDLLPIKGAHQ